MYQPNPKLIDFDEIRVISLPPPQTACVNLLLREKAISSDALARYGITKRDPIEVRFIKMSQDLLEGLDYVSKLTRGPEHISALMADGEQQGRAFVAQYVKETEPEKGDGRARRREPALGSPAARITPVVRSMLRNVGAQSGGRRGVTLCPRASRSLKVLSPTSG